ncbi:EamA family transporter [Geomonas nitrogeniifigens]|uniref:EamA family transporter n=2 Tax=Geomonas diazotrophica TaxID=2843197 RepID=A0ABX8JQ14_9BACT|nr:EamA family transporter [Geomonas nitrogeniifigens]
MPLWFPLTLLSAFFLATSDATTKRALTGRNEYLVTWLRIVPTLPLFLIPLLFIPVPKLGDDFYFCIFTGLPLEAVAIILYTKALKLSPLSLTLPLLSLTPLLLLVVPYLLLGERISAMGGAGILLIALGGYLLNTGRGETGILAPLRALAGDKGAMCMLGVAAIYSVTSTLGKRAIASSSPLFFAAVYLPLLVLVLTPVALYKSRGELGPALRNGTVEAALLPAVCYALQALTHVYAVNMTNVAYMIAVKRLSLLFGVLYGHYLFKEKGGIVSTLIMLAGVFLIVAGG